VSEASSAHTARAQALLEDLLARMGLAARVAVRPVPPSTGGELAAPILDVSGEDLGLLIGWRGETLRALQTILNLMMGDAQRDERPVIVDVERYRARREDQVRDLALRMADRVRRSGQRHTLDPMHGYERRVIHMTLNPDAGIRTESVGREPARRVIIHPLGPGSEV